MKYIMQRIDGGCLSKELYVYHINKKHLFSSGAVNNIPIKDNLKQIRMYLMKNTSLDCKYKIVPEHIIYEH